MTLVEIDRLSPAHVRELCALYQREWWTRGRGQADVEAMLAASGVVVGLCEEATDRLVAFARALHDGRYKALVLDVIVDEAWRGRGAGRRLMEALLARGELAGVAHVELYCRPELVPFYARFGFAPFPADLIAMRHG